MIGPADGLQGEGAMIPINYGNVTLFDAGTPNCAIEVNRDFMPALQAPLSVYAAHLMLNRALMSTYSAMQINRTGSKTRQNLISEMEKLNDFLHAVADVQRGNLKIDEQRFGDDQRGLAAEAMFSGLVHGLRTPCDIGSWDDDWGKGIDFTLFANTTNEIPVNITCSTWLDRVVEKFTRYKDPAIIVIPISSFSKSQSGRNLGELFGKKFDEEAYTRRMTKTINEMIKHDPVNLSSNRIDLANIETALQVADYREAAETMKVLADFNLRFMTALRRPEADERIKLTDERAEKTEKVSRRLLGEVGRRR